MGYAEKMQRLCALRGMDQASLARRVGLSRSSISRILGGLQEPKLRLAWILARALETSLDYLADDEMSVEPVGTWVRLSEDEATILKLVRRLGPEQAIDRLLNLSPGQSASAELSEAPGGRRG